MRYSDYRFRQSSLLHEKERRMNPFTPTFGMVPHFMAGRSALLQSMERAFQNGPGDPNLSSILIGPRGSGKTALLSCIGEIAAGQGWLVINVSASEGMLEDIYQQVESASAELLSLQDGRRLTGIQIGQLLGITWSEDPDSKKNWRGRMQAILRQLNERGTGLLITVDEVRADEEEMIRLASWYQLFIREGFRIAVIMAGLPFYVSQLVSHKEVSFLRRCRQHHLKSIADRDIASAIRQTIESAGKGIDEKSLSVAVQGSAGYAYMMQLIGFYIWEACGEREVISIHDAERGIEQAREDFRTGVLDSTWRELSKGDRRFLLEMLADEKYSRLAEVADRLRKSTGYASTYKKRLLAAGVIEEQAGNTFAFSIPYLREFLQEQV